MDFRSPTDANHSLNNNFQTNFNAPTNAQVVQPDERSEGSILDEKSFLEYDDISLGAGLQSSRNDTNIFKNDQSESFINKSMNKSPTRDQLDERVKQNLQKYEFNF